jgi:hypothetical protein
VNDALRVREGKDTSSHSLTRRNRCDRNQEQQRMQDSHSKRVSTVVGFSQVGELGSRTIRDRHRNSHFYGKISKTGQTVWCNASRLTVQIVRK